MPGFFVQKKTLIMEMVILIAVLGGAYYLYTMFSTEDVTTTSPTVNAALLGPNLTVFLKAVNEDKLTFKNTTFMDSALVKELTDHSQTIGVTNSRGRMDPFVPYASSRPLR